MTLVLENFYGYSVQGPRDCQQDRYLIEDTDTHQGAIICDGMGGHVNGDLAAQTVVDVLQSHEGKTFTRLVLANQEVNQALDNRATTVAAAHLVDNKLEVNWCGDSRVYIWRDYELIQLTRDHGYGHILVEYVGDNAYAGETRVFELEPDDVVILTTDGVHDYVNQMCNVLNRAYLADVKNLAKHLVEAALESCTHDNATAVTFTVKEQEP